MAETNKDEPFTRLTESLKEYSTVEININDLETAKEEILELLKTHRAVKLCDYKYGLSSKLIKDGRLIVKELQDISKVREYFYFKGTKAWLCCNRTSPRCKCRSSSLRILHGIIFAPIDHSETCELREYSFAMKIQDLLKDGKVCEARSLTSGRGYGKNKSNPSLSSSMINESTLSNAVHDDSSILEESVSANSTTTTASTDSRDTSPFQIPSPVATATELSSPPSATAVAESARSSVKREINENIDQVDSSIVEESVFANSTPASSDSRDTSPFQFSSPVASDFARSSVKREVDENDVEDCMIIEQPAAKKLKVVEESAPNETLEFHRPSTFILKQVCQKLNIDITNHACYNNAYDFWTTITFRNILPVTNNVQIHSFKSQNIFACLSLLFIGKTDSCFLIQHVINGAFRNDLIASGTKSTEEIEQLLINTVASDKQIEFIAKFLSCRFGIYYDSILKKFGKWENNEKEDVFTLILFFDGSLFSVVLDLA